MLEKSAETEGASVECETAAEDEDDDDDADDDEPDMRAAAAAAEAAVELTARPGGRPGLELLDEPAGWAGAASAPTDTPLVVPIHGRFNNRRTKIALSHLRFTCFLKQTGFGLNAFAENA